MASWELLDFRPAEFDSVQRRQVYEIIEKKAPKGFLKKHLRKIHGFHKVFLHALTHPCIVDKANFEEKVMSKKIDNRFVLPGLFFALLLSFASSSASAEELVMGTITADVAGTNDVLDGNYAEGIRKSHLYVDAASNVRRVAARTNLCIAYTATRQYEDATKWCDAAIEVGRRVSITKNNRAVLAYLMGNYDFSTELLSEAREAAHGYLIPSRLNDNGRVVELKIAELAGKEKFESFAKIN